MKKPPIDQNFDFLLKDNVNPIKHNQLNPMGLGVMGLIQN